MTRIGYNQLTVKVYSSGTTEVLDIDGALTHALIESYSTIYPAGIYNTARIIVPHDPMQTWLVKVGYRIAIYNGLSIVWEGQISAMGVTSLNGARATVLECLGRWSDLMEMRAWEKVWADNRIDAQTWVRQSVGDNDSYANVDLNSRISIGPQTIAWGNGEVVATFRYTMPTSETVKRWKCTSKNKPNTWKTQGWDSTGASELWSNVSAGLEESEDVTLGTPRQSVDFRFLSQAAQTPTGATYGRMYNVMIYSETGSITANSVMKNIRAHNTDLNSDESLISANSFALEPFKTNGHQSLAAIVQQICSYGDASNNPWAAYLAASDRATTPNGKPVLVYEQQPLLTDYDYVVRLGDKNVTSDPEFKLDLSEVYNWITVTYQDETGKSCHVTPDDDAALKDATSIAQYGERHLPQPIDAGVTTLANAKAIGKRVLAFKKTAKYLATQPIGVQGQIQAKSQNRINVCRVRAGTRLLILNSLNETPFLITATEYDPATLTCRITMGLPDRLAVFLARQARLNQRTIV